MAKHVHIQKKITHTEHIFDPLPVIFLPNTNWPLFRKRFSERIIIKRNFITIADITEVETNLTEQVQNAIRREIPITTINRRGLVTDEVRNLQRERNIS